MSMLFWSLVLTVYVELMRFLFERDQSSRVLQFLMGFHDSNNNVRGQILLMSPLPNIS